MKVLLFLLISAALVIQIFGFLGLIPLFISCPILFLAVYTALSSRARRRRFKGF